MMRDDAYEAGSLLNTKQTQVKVSVNHQIASEFKKACAASKVSMAAVLSQFMVGYYNGKVKSKATQDYSTRRKRKACVKRIILELEQLKAAEEHLIDKAPENLQDAPVYETADYYVSLYDEVIDQLREMVL